MKRSIAGARGGLIVKVEELLDGRQCVKLYLRKILLYMIRLTFRRKQYRITVYDRSESIEPKVNPEIGSKQGTTGTSEGNNGSTREGRDSDPPLV